MCGITGLVNFNSNESEQILERMVKTLTHRGPDDSGTLLYNIDSTIVGLGQTRLSIIDLSPGGHQPMVYKNLSIVYNGEVYNYAEIRSELKKLGHQFRSDSDTEVILHAFCQWGIECIHHFIGMFAFVILDRDASKLYAFRDRAGVKPLYYYRNRGLFLFGSELKSLMAHPGFGKEIDSSSVKAFFDYGYVPAPYSIFRDTRKLDPGSYMVLDLAENHLECVQYWEAAHFYRQPKLDIGYDEAKQELHSLLKSAFNYRMIADVPVGVFLSGGYDSNAVASVLQQESNSRIKTFTIGFNEGNNEAPYAHQTASILGTDHNELICTTTEAQELIPELPYYYDEPFADSSAIPTMLVSRFARELVTVALSADAGDELFAGYKSYPLHLKNLSLLNRVPGNLKPSASRLLHLFSKAIPAGYPDLRHKMDSVSKAINSDQMKQAADLFRLAHSMPDQYLRNLFINEPKEYKTDFHISTDGFKNEAEVAMAVDYRSYLQNDILTKVDRATMSVSLEGREPLLDHRLIEFSARLPFEYKFDGFSTKRILKDIVHEYLPKELMDRPKSGFSLPIYSWLRGDLSWLIDEYLNEKEMSASGLFQVPFLLKKIQLFNKNKLHYSPFIWKLLMFQMWYKRWME